MTAPCEKQVIAQSGYTAGWEEGFWTVLESVLEPWTDVRRMRAHGVDLLAAHFRRSAGRTVPASLQQEVIAQTVVSMTVRSELERIRAIVDGPIVLMKGYDLAVRYPDPSLRPYWDLDILVRDADTAQAALVNAGCVPYVYGEVEWAPDHHRTPLKWPESILHIEVHQAPSWVDWQPRPNAEEFFEHAVASVTGIDGIRSLDPVHYAIVIAAHSWHHGPLEKLLHLIDFKVVADSCDEDALQVQSAQWGLGGVVSATQQAVDALFRDNHVDNPVLRRWIEHLREGRERSAAEHYLSVWGAGMWASTPPQRLEAVSNAIAGAVRPRRGLRTSTHLARMARRMRHALGRAYEYRNQP